MRIMAEIFELIDSLNVSVSEMESLLKRATEIAEYDDWWSRLIFQDNKLKAVPCDYMSGTTKAIVFKDGSFELYDKDARNTYRERASLMRTDDNIPDLEPHRLAVLVSRAARMAIDEDKGCAMIICLKQPYLNGETHDAVTMPHNLGKNHYVVFPDGSYEKFRKTQTDTYYLRGEEIRKQCKLDGTWFVVPYATAVLNEDYEKVGGYSPPIPAGTHLDVINDSDHLFRVKVKDGTQPNRYNCFWVEQSKVNEFNLIEDDSVTLEFKF